MAQRTGPKRGALPFRVRVATSDVDLAELVSVRSNAYARHSAPGASNLRVAEKQDTDQDAILLLARSKVDGAALGSVRVQTRLLKPLMVESAMTLPFRRLRRRADRTDARERSERGARSNGRQL